MTLDRPNLKILVEYLEGPFSNLENRWTLRAEVGRARCDVGFFIAYEFKSRMLAMLMGTMFDPRSSGSPRRSKSAPTRSTARRLRRYVRGADGA